NECQEAFERLKEALITAPVLALPDFQKGFVLTTDASTTGIAYILGQKDDEGKEHPVWYGGRGLHPNEKKWGITELECLALVEGIKQYHTYLASREFEAVTDHVSLTYLQKMKLAGNNRLTRWALFLQPYKFKITYKKGELLTSADAISRSDNLPPPPEQTEEDWEVGPTICTATGSARKVKFAIPENVIIPDSDSGADPRGTVLHFEEEHLEPDAARELPGLPTIDDVSAAQRVCPDFAPIRDYLIAGQLPPDDSAARRLVHEAADYVVLGNALYHLYSPRTRRLDRAMTVIRQLCVPTPMRPIIATELHDNCAHLGFDRVYATARSRYYWPGMYKFLHDHVVTCEACQKAKRPVHAGKNPIISLPVAPVCSRWHADYHGPLPESEGCRYILVIIDSTSMWPELIAVADTTAETFVRAFYDVVIARFGVPKELTLLTDNGSAFTSKLTSLFCKTFGIKQCFCTPYHQQTNARAENLAVVIHDSLKIICEKQTDWAKHLQSVAMAYRATPAANTALSPHEIIFGKPMPTSLDWALAPTEQATPGAEQYALEIGPKLEAMRKIAMENVADSAVRQRRPHNEDAQPPTFKEGDKVLLRDLTVKKGESGKLKNRYDGPYVVTKCEPNFNYRLQHFRTGRTLRRPVHADRLRPLEELPNDYRLGGTKQSTVVAHGRANGVNWRVLIADYTTAEADVFLRFVDSGFLFLTPMGLPMEGLDAAMGTTYKCALRHLGVPGFRNCLNDPEPIVVTNPELLNFGAVMHVPDRED
ncbi:MAG TPA: RNase H-like domain-containing protein, partial [Methylomicrobium sp.]|nr:RNase H-like domain-containing protein [Methylomicrobium sp.]